MKLCGQMRNIFYVILIILSTATNYNCRNGRGRTNQDTTVIENEYLRIISYNGNKGYCNDILENIMSKYFTILNDLGVNNVSKITIRIYPTLDSFHQATNMVGSSNWVVATSWG